MYVRCNNNNNNNNNIESLKTLLGDSSLEFKNVQSEFYNPYRNYFGNYEIGKKDFWTRIAIFRFTIGNQKNSRYSLSNS